MLCSVTWEPAVIKHQIRAQAHRNHLKISTKLLCSIKTSRQVQHDNYSQEPINHVHLQLISIATQPITLKSSYQMCQFVNSEFILLYLLFPPAIQITKFQIGYLLLMHHHQYMGFEGQAKLHGKLIILGETGAQHFSLLQFKSDVNCTLRNS